MGQSIGDPGGGPDASSFQWEFLLDDLPVLCARPDALPDLRRLSPSRTFRSSAKSRHVPVDAYCSTVGAPMRLESGLEHGLLLHLDRDPSVTWILAQPARLHFKGEGRRRRSHVPDLLSLSQSGQVTVWDVRPSARQDQRFLDAAAATERACLAWGWGYEVHAGHDPVYLANLRWIAAYRTPMPWHSQCADELQSLLRSQPQPLSALLEADQGDGHLISALWHLVWMGQIMLDLHAPLQRHSPARWAP